MSAPLQVCTYILVAEERETQEVRYDSYTIYGKIIA